MLFWNNIFNMLFLNILLLIWPLFYITFHTSQVIFIHLLIYFILFILFWATVGDALAWWLLALCLVVALAVYLCEFCVQCLAVQGVEPESPEQVLIILSYLSVPSWLDFSLLYTLEPILEECPINFLLMWTVFWVHSAFLLLCVFL